MKEGKIVDRVKIKKGNKEIEIVIRYPKKSDLRAIWKFYNKVIKETEFLSRISPVSLKEEKKWLKDVFQKMKKKDLVCLLVEHGGRIVGSTTVGRETEQTHLHEGVYGISILQSYTGCGIGKKLTNHVISLARKEMKLEIIYLVVVGKNKIARKLYRKTGFKYAGKIPKGIKRGKEYQDEIIMYKALR